jgi:hypothetical protein
MLLSFRLFNTCLLAQLLPNANRRHATAFSLDLLWRDHRPTAQQRNEELSLGSHLIKPDASVLHDQFLKRCIHRARLPDFANDLQRHGTVLVHVLPCEMYFQTLRHAIIGKAPNPSVLNGVVFAGQWFHKVLTVDNPMPTASAPVRFGSPMVNVIGLGFELAGIHRKILSR